MIDNELAYTMIDHYELYLDNHYTIKGNSQADRIRTENAEKIEKKLNEKFSKNYDYILPPSITPIKLYYKLYCPPMLGEAKPIMPDNSTELQGLAEKYRVDSDEAR